MLKDDGVYVLTTEFHYGDEVIPAPHNYYFSSGFLDELVRAASFVAAGGVACAVSPHPFNRPVPEKLGDLCADPVDALTDSLLNAAPHVQLLTSGLPFTSMSLVLTKAAPGVPAGVLPMAGLDEARRLIDAGVRRWKTFVENAPLNLDPFGLMGDRRPGRGVPRLAVQDGDRTLFHTGYVWLGGVARTVTVELEAWPAGAAEAAIELRLHRHQALLPETIIGCASIAVAVRSRQRVRVCLPIAAEAGCSYAVLGQVTTGGCWFDAASVRVNAGGAEPS